MTRLGFQLWLAAAQPGERYVYWVGNLARDRGGQKPLAEKTKLERDVDGLADDVAAAAGAGLVTLTQKRSEDEAVYQYIATRTLVVR